MANEVCMSATCKCCFGTSPAVFTVLAGTVNTESKPAATIMDFLPSNFIPQKAPFQKCAAPSNPEVIASGKPGDCEALFSNPWVPGSPTALIQGKPALTFPSILMCETYKGGTIEFITPGEATLDIP